MRRILIKLLPIILLWSIFILVIFKIPYPQNLSQASISQMIYFFMPLLLALSLSINLFFKNIFSAVSISVGIILLLLLKAIEALNIVTAILIIIATALFVSYFNQTKRNNLIKGSKIPKLKNFGKKL